MKIISRPKYEDVTLQFTCVCGTIFEWNSITDGVTRIFRKEVLEYKGRFFVFCPHCEQQVILTKEQDSRLNEEIRRGIR
jgi:hypothetical protein